MKIFIFEGSFLVSSLNIYLILIFFSLVSYYLLIDIIEVECLSQSKGKLHAIRDVTVYKLFIVSFGCFVVVFFFITN